MPAFPSRQWVEDVATAVDEDEQFDQYSRAFTATIRFDFGDNACALTVDEGSVRSVHHDPTFTTWDVALRAPVETWQEFLVDTPEPQHNDLLALWLRGNLTMEGNLKLAVQHLRPLKRLLRVVQEVDA